MGLKGDDEFLARARVLERRGRIRVMLMRLFLGVERWLYFFVKVSGEKACCVWLLLRNRGKTLTLRVMVLRGVALWR